MKIRRIVASAVIAAFLGGLPALAHAAPYHPGWGDYDVHHAWHPDYWWMENHPNWVRAHHPEWAKNGDWDEHHHYWHDRSWWVRHDPEWVHKHHHDWF
jgi:hypothetical protein